MGIHISFDIHAEARDFPESVIQVFFQNLLRPLSFITSSSLRIHRNLILRTVEKRKEGANDFVIVLRWFAFIAQELDARFPTIQKGRGRYVLSCESARIVCEVSLKARANVPFQLVVWEQTAVPPYKESASRLKLEK